MHTVNHQEKDVEFITDEEIIPSLEIKKVDKQPEKPHVPVGPVAVGIGIATASANEPKEREFEKLWKLIHTTSPDFGTWTKLLSCADNDENIAEIRQAYDAFLKEYPLCFVYWKKYADHELNRGSAAKAMQTYEKALTTAIPHSVELWSHYCGYVAEKSDNLDEIRSLFERGLKIVGNDFGAHLLWDKYLGFETSQEEWKRIGSIFLRILEIPLDQITNYWDRFKLFVASRPVEDVCSSEDLAQLARLRLDSQERKKQWLVSEKEKVYQRTLEQSTARRVYETEAMKINYFHVRPLDDTQLNNWVKYLEFEEAQGDHARIVKLYERCIIPCCNYTKFWLRYVRYLEKHARSIAQAKNVSSFDPVDARNILERVTTIFMKKRPDIHLEYALFEEHYMNYDEARAIYQKIQKIAPGHVESTLRLIGMERRLKNIDKCEAIFAENMKKITDETQSLFFFLEYCKFCMRVYKDLKKTREVFREGIEKFGKHKEIWIYFVNFEKTIRGKDLEQRVSAIYNEAVHKFKGLSEVDRLALLLDWIAFFSDEGADLQELRNLTQEYKDQLAIYEASAHTTTSATTSHSTHHKRPHEADQASEPPQKVPRTNEFNNLESHPGTDYSYYNHYYGYDYNSYNYPPYAGYEHHTQN